MHHWLVIEYCLWLSLSIYHVVGTWTWPWWRRLASHLIRILLYYLRLPRLHPCSMIRWLPHRLLHRHRCTSSSLEGWLVLHHARWTILSHVWMTLSTLDSIDGLDNLVLLRRRHLSTSSRPLILTACVLQGLWLHLRVLLHGCMVTRRHLLAVTWHAVVLSLGLLLPVVRLLERLLLLLAVDLSWLVLLLLLHHRMRLWRSLYPLKLIEIGCRLPWIIDLLLLLLLQLWRLLQLVRMRRRLLLRLLWRLNFLRRTSLSLRQEHRRLLDDLANALSVRFHGGVGLLESRHMYPDVVNNQWVLSLVYLLR